MTKLSRLFAATAAAALVGAPVQAQVSWTDWTSTGHTTVSGRMNIGGSAVGSRPVVNPVLALASWNMGTPVSFSAPLEVVSYGEGYFGNGTLTAEGNQLKMTGAGYGTIRFNGTFSSIELTDTNEYWHGFTVGASGLPATSSVPEPSTYVMMATRLLGLGGVARRRRKA